jgi:hypothetical protein
MCDYFLERMEGDQAGGDLTDVVRAGGVVPRNAEVPSSSAAEWYPLHGEPSSSLLFPAPPPSSSDGSCGLGSAGGDVFGDPFAGIGDPFSTDYSSGADFFDANAMPDAMAKVGFDTAVGNGSGSCGGGQLLDLGRKPLLPRGVQMPAVGLVGPPVLSPPRAIRPYPPMGGDMVKLRITAGQMAGCAIDAAAVGMQMSSSPRAAGGIKRRLGRYDDCFLAFCFCMYTRYTACDCLGKFCDLFSTITILPGFLRCSHYGTSKGSSGCGKNWKDRLKCYLQLEVLGAGVIVNTWCVINGNISVLANNAYA